LETIAKKGYTPLAIFKKIKRVGGYFRSVPSGQISPLSLLKCGLTTPKIAEMGNFWYKFAQKGYTALSDFFTKFGLGMESQVLTFTPNFVTVG